MSDHEEADVAAHTDPASATRKRTRRAGHKRARTDAESAQAEDTPVAAVSAASTSHATSSSSRVARRVETPPGTPRGHDDDGDHHYVEAAASKRASRRVEDHTTTAAAATADDGTGDAQQHGDASTETRAAAFASPKVLRHAPSNRAYDDLGLNPLLVKSLRETFNFESLTDIQAACIPPALSGNDILAEAKTGAGKTLAFLIPIVETLTRAGFKPINGTGAIVIGPTRELCQQIEGVLLRLLKHFNGSITFLCCIGGINRKAEGYKLVAGQQIVVSTPGRLLDHLTFTEEWQTKRLLVLCVDEADRVLDNGFEEDMRQIVQRLPTKRQTLLFSATQTTRVEQLARVSFQRRPIFISLKTKQEQATVDTLEQGYVICPSDKRLLLLYQFVKKNLSKKVIVFFSSRNSVSFHCELFNYIDVPCVAFHGKQKQHQRSATFMQFCNSPSGILFTTDVASRGLDIPKVDWIVQFDPPDDPTKYIHRVGRTARAGRVGQAMMFLLPSEQLFLKYLQVDAKVLVSEFVFDLSKLNDELQQRIMSLVSGNYYLRQSANLAFEGYLLSYSASQLKNVFNVQQLDLNSVAKGFGLPVAPPVRLDLAESAAHLNKKKRAEFKSKQMRFGGGSSSSGGAASRTPHHQHGDAGFAE